MLEMCQIHRCCDNVGATVNMLAAAGSKKGHCLAVTSASRHSGSHQLAFISLHVASPLYYPADQQNIFPSMAGGRSYLQNCGGCRPVLLSRVWTCSSAEVMVLPKGSGNSRSPHLLPLLKAAVSSSSPLMSRGKGMPLGSNVKGFISINVKSRSRNTCQQLVCSQPTGNSQQSC